MIVVLYNYVSHIAFLPEHLHRLQSTHFYRSQRSAYNVIANLLCKEEDSEFIRKNN